MFLNDNDRNKQIKNVVRTHGSSLFNEGAEIYAERLDDEPVFVCKCANAEFAEIIVTKVNVYDVLTNRGFEDV